MNLKEMAASFFTLPYVQGRRSGNHARVVDLYDGGVGKALAISVCLDCRKLWNEGADVPEYPLECAPWRK